MGNIKIENIKEDIIINLKSDMYIENDIKEKLKNALILACIVLDYDFEYLSYIYYKSRKMELVLIRYMAIYLFINIYNINYSGRNRIIMKIGYLLNIDRTTCLHGLKVVDNLLYSNKLIKNKTLALLDEIKKKKQEMLSDIQKDLINLIIKES